METKDLATVASTAGKPIPDEIESARTGSDFEPDARRRRLVRGALVAAPVMLTLRSGMGAASSACLPAKDGFNSPVTLQQPPDPDGRIPTGTNASATPADYCFQVTGESNAACAGENGEFALVSRDYITGDPYPVVEDPENSGNLFCGPSGTRLTGGTNVAILSSQAANSFLGV